MEAGMRGLATLVLLAAMLVPVTAQEKPAAKPQAAAKRQAAPKPPAPGSPRAVYAAMTEPERIAIQSDLIWTGDYNGIASGDFGDNSVAAVKAYQKRHAAKETGILNPDERVKLREAARTKQEQAGWRVLDDNATGARLGLPGKLVPQSSPGTNGSRWQSARGEVQVETFRIAAPIALGQVFEQQKKDPPQRKVEYSVLRENFFVLSGLQGLKKFYVRAHAKEGEVRGLTILYDQAMEGIMEPVVVAMSSTFTPFPGNVALASARRKVEYGTGVVVGAGHVVTDGQTIEACEVVVIAGRGHAEKIADADGLALLRLNGARDLAPLPLTTHSTDTGAVTLVGIVDPQAQSGGAVVSSASARLNGGARIEPAPPMGFAGAAVLDGGGQFIGIAATRASGAQVAGPAAAPAGGATTLLPAEAIGKLIAANGVTPPSGRASLEAAKAAAVRVICVRK
jgi:hypothetical protein